MSHAASGVDIFLHHSGFPLQSPDLKAGRVKETHTHTLFPQRKKNKFEVMLFLGRSCPRQQRDADISHHVGVEALKNYVGHSCNPTTHINVPNKYSRKFRYVWKDRLYLETLQECMIISPKHAACVLHALYRHTIRSSLVWSGLLIWQKKTCWCLKTNPHFHLQFILACFVVNVCGKLATCKDVSHANFLPLLLSLSCIHVVGALKIVQEVFGLLLLHFFSIYFFFLLMLNHD